MLHSTADVWASPDRDAAIVLSRAARPAGAGWPMSSAPVRGLCEKSSGAVVVSTAGCGQAWALRSVTAPIEFVVEGVRLGRSSRCRFQVAAREVDGELATSSARCSSMSQLLAK